MFSPCPAPCAGALTPHEDGQGAVEGEHNAPGFQKHGAFMTSHEEETLDYKKAKMGIVFTCVFLANFLVALCGQFCSLQSKTPGQPFDVTLACVLCINVCVYTYICVHTRTHTSTYTPLLDYSIHYIVITYDMVIMIYIIYNKLLFYNNDFLYIIYYYINHYV